MHKRTAGMLFVCIAAFLYGVRYLSAAIYGSGAQSWSRPFFQDLLRDVGPELRVLSLIALALGAGYLIAAEFGIPFKGAFRDIRTNWREFDTRPQPEEPESRDRGGVL
ncbi:hypothetical protein [Cohnella zeiphila]|uniref:Uncharacterized protein n=1 Tax=Cohnella zeiphila TaxID=2761120 RepID=A0A7X0SSW8_9BACL|nr:hypothetical protein [Cohnella zeiphila]MBB6735514.1 hypothetical protein [Cohnella zeiphila]